MLRMAYGIGFAVALLGTVSPAAFAVGIGTITEVVNQAYRTPPGAAEILAKVNDALVTDEALRTDEDSTISVRFVDGSELSVEAGSELVLSDYVFDEQTTASSGVIQLDNGLFHYNSNGKDDSKIALQTPVATIGIRGTEFLVTVDKGATVVDIVDGAVEVKPRGGGKAITCQGGQSILVAGAKSDAVCGDFGSFSTAAGTPPTTQIAD
ncbi:MAG TPA: FecR family protein, partial [Dongiaceae bacterium]